MSENRDERIMVNLTATDRATIEAAARRLGLDLGAYLRMQALKAARTQCEYDKCMLHNMPHMVTVPARGQYTPGEPLGGIRLQAGASSNPVVVCGEAEA